uniref:Uncharacterized protein n=1 Tax=Oryza barthii TaxID=65489 RepID=A0A0D3FJW3_9ORYZ
MAVPVVEQPVQAAATDWMGRLQVTAEGLRDIGALVAAAATRIRGRARRARRGRQRRRDPRRRRVVRLAHAGQAPIPDATVDAAAKLLATVVHNNVEFHFLTCAPYLHVRAGDLTDLTWFAWSKQTERAKKLATEAELWINAAAWEAKDAAERARSHCLVQSPERNEHMGELEVSLLMATRYADKALAAVDMVRDAVESMDQTLH